MCDVPLKPRGQWMNSEGCISLANSTESAVFIYIMKLNSIGITKYRLQARYLPIQYLPSLNNKLIYQFKISNNCIFPTNIIQMLQMKQHLCVLRCIGLRSKRMVSGTG